MQKYSGTNMYVVVSLYLSILPSVVILLKDGRRVGWPPRAPRIATYGSEVDMLFQYYSACRLADQSKTYFPI